MERRFGFSFGHLRIHADRDAAASADKLHALAYTTGAHIVFGAGYAPTTTAGKRLLAHELAHVVQQAEGSVPEGVGSPDTRHEQAAIAAAGSESLSHGAGPVAPRPIATSRMQPYALQRQVAPAAPQASDALIPIADFISYVETVERTFPSDSPEAIVTRIRVEYYSGFAFESLIPDASYRRLAPAYAQPPAGGFTPLYYPNNLSAMRGTPATDPAYRHLTAHADENRSQDNPSPYIVMPDGSRVDAGHVVLGLDSLLHPRVSEPFAAYAIPGIDPANFAADLALAAYWTTYHEREGAPAADAAVRPAKADFDAYYKASAPNEDLLGDADAFGAKGLWTSGGAQPLSSVLRNYYLGAAGRPPAVEQRWRTFCAANGLGYTIAAGSVTWGVDIEAKWVPRIARLCDLFDAGFFSKASSVAVGSAPSRATWPYSAPALRRFLTWLKPRLEAEIKAHP